MAAPRSVGAGMPVMADRAPETPATIVMAALALNARLNSAPDWNLRAGSFSSAFSTTRPMTAGTVAWNDLSSAGASWTILYMIVVTVSPANGRSPVSISYSTAPNEKRSLRPSTCLPITCSGDM